MVQNFYKQALNSVYSDSLKCRSWRGKKIWDGEKIAIRLKRQNGELISSEHNSFRGKCFFFMLTFVRKQFSILVRPDS